MKRMDIYLLLNYSSVLFFFCCFFFQILQIIKSCSLATGMALGQGRRSGDDFVMRNLFQSVISQYDVSRTINNIDMISMLLIVLQISSQNMLFIEISEIFYSRLELLIGIQPLRGQCFCSYLQQTLCGTNQEEFACQ